MLRRMDALRIQMGSREERVFTFEIIGHHLLQKSSIGR